MVSISSPKTSWNSCRIELAKSLDALPRQVVLDGEIVAVELEIQGAGFGQPKMRESEVEADL